MLACAAAFLGIGAPTAGAATAGTTYVPLSPSPFGEEQKNMSPATGGDVAISQATGNIYIANHQDVNVGIWAPVASDPGASLLVKAAPGNLDPENIAVDSSDDSIYFADTLFGAGIEKLVSDGAPTPTYTPDGSFVPDVGFWRPSGVAVDPTTHDVIVADTDQGLIYRLDSSGTSQAAYDGGGAFQAPTAVAVGVDGTIYVVSSGDHSVQRLSPDGSSEGALQLPLGAEASAITVNAVSGEVAVFVKESDGASLEFFDENGNHLKTAPLPADITESHGLAWDVARDRIYLSLGVGLVRTLVTAIQPGIDPPVVESFGRNTAHVSTEVAPGGETTTAGFEYCPAGAKCSSFPAADSTDPHNPWTRGPAHEGITADETIEDDLPLTSNMQWQIRGFAENSLASNRSPVTNFDSPAVSPGVETGPAGSVTDSGAVLSGTIDTGGDLTTYHFEYGLTSSYGSTVPASGEAAAGNNRLPLAVTKPVSGLQAGTTYHYRLVATNSIGTSAGADRTFTTASAGESPPHRVYEQVTPTDKRGAQISGDFHVQTSPDGSAIAIATSSGSTDGETANIRQNYMIRRGETNWADWVPVDAPQAAMSGIFESSTAALSPDFEHALVISNRALAAGGIEGGGNLYIKDLSTGTYTFVGGAPGIGAYQAMAGPTQNEVIYITGAPDFSWILINGLAPLLPGAPQRAVYRWSKDEGLSIESLLPGDVVSSTTQVTTKGVLYWRTTSDDGSVVYFGEDNGGGPGPLYRRENGETTLVSHGDGTFLPTTFAAAVILDGVSSNGRYAVFHTANPIPFPLTGDTPLGNFAVYRYDAVTDTVTYLTDRATGGSPDVLGVSDDTGTVYLDKAANTDGRGGPVVVWRDGVVRTITTGNVIAPTNAGSGGVIQSMSPSGRYFVWVNGDGTLRMYDAVEDQVVCISCTSDGSPAGIARTRNVDRTIGNRAPQVVNDAGLVFFDSAARLTSEDHNGARDVYSYYRGRLTLISPGNADYDAMFVDASADGRDVFFQTAQGLVGQDTDGNNDIYDARIDGGFASQSGPAPSPSCVRTECGDVGNNAPAGPTIGSGKGKNGTTRRVISGVKGLSASDRVRLASGRKARLRLRVNGPGVVRASGNHVIFASVKAKGPGAVAIPIGLKKRALAQLDRKGSLSVRLTVAFGEARKTISFEVRSSGGKKGARS
jgi:WD40 repeat protein